jgi:hypothetical protein
MATTAPSGTPGGSSRYQVICSHVSFISVRQTPYRGINHHASPRRAKLMGAFVNECRENQFQPTGLRGIAGAVHTNGLNDYVAERDDG